MMSTKLSYNCKVMLQVSNGTGSTCRIVTHIRNNYHTYDLFDYVEFIDVDGLTRGQTRKFRETFGITEPLGMLHYNSELHTLQSNLIDIRFQIVRIYTK